MEKKKQQQIIIVILLGVFLAAIAKGRLAPKKDAGAPRVSAGKVKEKPAEEIVTPQAADVAIEYKTQSAKDPFRSPVVKRPAIKLPEKVEANIILPAMTLKGIIWNVDEPMAIINDSVLKIGDTIQDAEIRDIEKGIVYLNYRGKDFTLVMPEDRIR